MQHYAAQDKSSLEPKSDDSIYGSWQSGVPSQAAPEHERLQSMIGNRGAGEVMSSAPLTRPRSNAIVAGSPPAPSTPPASDMRDFYSYDGGSSSSPMVGSPDVASSGPAAPDPKYQTKAMEPGMTSFDSNLQRAGVAGAPLPSKTFYADSDDKRAPYKRGIQDGKITSGDGSNLDTIGALRPPAHGGKADRHIFTMDDQGEFYSADAIAETNRRGQEAQTAGKTEQERFHHSSFLAGQDVAGAGEMQVRDGQVEIVSDTSGHYKPGSKQMLNTVKELDAQKAGVERIGTEFVGKGGGQETLRGSALEVLGYEGHGEENIETQMRASHAKKDSVMAELLSKSGSEHLAHPAKYKQPAPAASENHPYTYSEISNEQDDEAHYNS